MKHLSSAQLEIMLIIWDAEKPVSRSEIQRRIPENKWKTTTINTFLSRLASVGVLKSEHKGREYIYIPLIEKNEYLEFEGKSILKKAYNNSIQFFIASVCGNGKMSNEELDDLQSYLQKLKEGGDDDVK